MSSQKELNCGLKSEDIAAIRNVFKKFPKISKAILYGSRAKGNYRPGSDIDLTLQGESLNYTDLVAIETALDDLLLPYTIDLSIYQQIENSELIAHIERVGQEIYRKA